MSLGKFGSFPANALIGRPYYLTWDILDGTGYGLRLVPTEDLIREQLEGGPVTLKQDDAESDEPSNSASPHVSMEDDALEVQINSDGEENIEISVPLKEQQQDWTKETKNNREIRDDATSQTMTWQEIEKLKKSGGTSGGRVHTSVTSEETC